MRSLLAEHEPQFPVGADIRVQSNSRRREYGYEPLTQNLMETHLAALTSPVSQGWGKRSYVAVTKHGIDALSAGVQVAIILQGTDQHAIDHSRFFQRWIGFITGQLCYLVTVILSVKDRKVTDRAIELILGR